MNELAYLGGLAVAAVLALAGVAKLAAPRQIALQFRQLGLGAASSVLSWFVPLAELTVALALVVSPRVGGPAAVVLLAGFTVLLVTVVRRRSDVGCACFGATADRPVTVVDLARNAILVGLAATAAFATPTVPSLPALVIASLAVLGAVVAGALLELRRQSGAIWVGPAELAEGGRP